MNQVNMIGRLTNYTDILISGDKTIAKFTLAVYRDKDNTDFIPCVAFGKTAQTIAQYTQKGSQVGIEGRLQSGRFENKEGKTIYTLDVIVNRVELLGSKKEAAQATNTSQPAPTFDDPLLSTQTVWVEDDELPFY